MFASKQQRLEESLLVFLKKGSHDLLSWLFEMEEKYKNNFINSEKILEGIWENFVRNGPNNPDIFHKLVGKSSRDFRPKITNLFASLIKTKDPNQFSTLIKILVDKNSNWPDEIISELRVICINTANESNHPVNIQLYECAVNSSSSSAYYELKAVAEKIIPLIDDQNPAIQSDVFRLLDLINQKVDRLGKQIGVFESIEKAKSYLSANDIKGKPFLDFAFNYGKKLTTDEKNELTTLIEQQINIAKPNQMRLLGLGCISKIDDYSRIGILKKIIELGENVPEQDSKELCISILMQYKDDLSSSQKTKVTQIFGKNIFGDAKTE